MFVFRKFVVLYFVFYFAFSSYACAANRQRSIRIADLIEASSNTDLTLGDRLKWKTVLKWCDECDEKFRGIVGSEFSNDDFGGIFIDPISEKQFLVTIYCAGAAYQNEMIYYKITQRNEDFESQLLSLEQYEFIDAPNQDDANPERDPCKERELKGEFVKYVDALAYGVDGIDPKTKHLVLERRFRGSGGCGYYIEYDVSGDTAKVVEFRAKPFCSCNYVEPKKWKAYPADERAKWRVVPSPLREDWKDSDQCR